MREARVIASELIGENMHFLFYLKYLMKHLENDGEENVAQK